MTCQDYMTNKKQIQPISSRNLSNKSSGTYNGLRFLKEQKINGKKPMSVKVFASETSNRFGLIQNSNPF